MSDPNIQPQNILQRYKLKLDSFFNHPVAVAKVSFGLIILMTVVSITNTLIRYYMRVR
jgi:hypothetical protein